MITLGSSKGLPEPRPSRVMVATAFLLLIALLALSVPVAASLGVLGLLLSELYSPMPLRLAMGEVAWGASTSFILVAVPFFILLGEVLLRSISARRSIRCCSRPGRAGPARHRR